MSEFESIEDFVSQLSSDIDDTMSTYVAYNSILEVTEQAKQRVYAKYIPRVYERRYSLISPYNWYCEKEQNTSDSNHSIGLYSSVKPNPYAILSKQIKGEATTDKDLFQLIELGQDEYTEIYGEVGYNYPKKKSAYMKPRPFLKNTIKILRSSLLSDSFKMGMANKGYNIE